MCHYLSTIDTYVSFFFSCVYTHTSRLVQNGLVLHPELSGESKHRRNLDTKCPENVQKCPECVQTLLRIKAKGIQKSSMLMGWLFSETEVRMILIGQYFSQQVLRYTIPVCAESGRHTRKRHTSKRHRSKRKRHRSVYKSHKGIFLWLKIRHTSKSHRSIHLSVHPRT